MTAAGAPRAKAPGFKMPMTNVACPRCLPLALAHKIQLESVQRLPEGAWAPRSKDPESKPCCIDCSAADLLVRMQTYQRGAKKGEPWDDDVRTGRESMLTFEMARIAVSNDRCEQYRLPGVRMGLVLAGITKPSERGDLEEQYAWLETQPWYAERTPASTS